MSGPPARELTRSERAAIRRLVTELCANYDSQEKLCLPLDCSCYMLCISGGPGATAVILRRLCCQPIRLWNRR